MKAVDANISRSRGPDAILAGVTDTQPPRARPSFAEIGRAAAREAQRSALLAELNANGWNLRAAAEALQMGDASAVIRALKNIAPAEYEASKGAGVVRPGAPGHRT